MEEPPRARHAHQLASLPGWFAPLGSPWVEVGPRLRTCLVSCEGVEAGEEEQEREESGGEERNDREEVSRKPPPPAGVDICDLTCRRLSPA